MMEPKRERSGFFSSMLLGFSGFSWLLQHPGAWPAAAVPALVWALLSSLGVTASIEWVKPWVMGALPHWSEGLLGFAAWALTLLVGAGAIWVALLLTPPLSSPALERIVARVEADIGAPARAPQSFVAELWCGLRATLVGVALVTPIFAVAIVLDLLVPVLAPLWIAIKLLAAAFGMSWGLLDYPLTLRGMRVRERLGLMRRHARVVLGFGLGMLPFFWLPCCLFVSLPVGVVAATLLYAELALEAEESMAMPS
jgi:CysZ protein